MVQAFTNKTSNKYLNLTMVTCCFILEEGWCEGYKYGLCIDPILNDKKITFHFPTWLFRAVHKASTYMAIMEGALAIHSKAVSATLGFCYWRIMDELTLLVEWRRTIILGHNWPYPNAFVNVLMHCLSGQFSLFSLHSAVFAILEQSANAESCISYSLLLNFS